MFQDDFEDGLTKWDLNEADKIRIINSGDPNYGEVLSLTPGGSRQFRGSYNANQFE